MNLGETSEKLRHSSRARMSGSTFLPSSFRDKNRESQGPPILVGASKRTPRCHQMQCSLARSNKTRKGLRNDHRRPLRDCCQVMFDLKWGGLVFNSQEQVRSSFSSVFIFLNFANPLAGGYFDPHIRFDLTFLHSSAF